ncbi:hypothetical protein I6E17_02015 [Fusobacterium perfoetens]|uniref:hypothetical protein n=1 Tax=Fusobacterium perfoetens TaxID=852 RepID=UPI001F3BA4C8|nr:hypothetical protein [Fusobacterium perfoetens]MCF2624951.1 hypothetical protein [Fusobacterium perfoetens]
MIEITNSIATVISSLAALATIYLVIKQYKDSKKSDTKHFWYRNYILNNDLKDYEKIFSDILDIYKNNNMSDTDKLLVLKEKFNTLREFFYKVEFFDNDLYKQLNNFINTCEEECMSNINMESENILVMKSIFLKSLFEYELNDYKDFRIKYH